jgi:LysM repeat protein
MVRTRVRWGRVGVLALSAGLAIGVLAGRAGAGSPSGGAAPAAASRTIHVVQPGETLWGMAQRLAGPEGDPRPVVDRLISLNHLQGGTLHPGDRLVIPPD